MMKDEVIAGQRIRRSITMTGPDSERLYEAFPIPETDGTTYRPIIVWAMNDRLDGRELTSQLDGFAQCGYGGVMIMPWGGLPYAFMADEWLDSVAHILAHAKTIGLEVWIWDDWIFGSGAAGGKVTENRDYRAKDLQKAMDLIVEAGECLDLHIPARTLAVATFTVDKFGNPTETPLPLNSTPGERIQFAPMTRSRLILVCWQYISGLIHSTRSHGMFLEPSISAEACDIYSNDDRDIWSVDMLNPEATQEYLNCIHERYRERVSEYFGNTLKGFFYDEPKVSTIHPWTEDFPKRFKAIKGYDLIDYLPAIMIDLVQNEQNVNDLLRDEPTKRAAADYRDVWTTLIAKGFYKPIQTWCQAHGVVATGHQLGDNSFEEMFYCGGLYFKNLVYSDMPGGDIIQSQIRPETFLDSPRFAGSMAACLGRSRAMSESCAVFGHGITIDEMRYVCDQQMARGVNKFFVKLSNYNREKSRHFHPPELSDTNPIIKHYGQLFCESVAHLARLLNGGSRGRAMALYVPLGNFYHNDRSFAAVTNDMARKLTYNQVDFDYVWDRDLTGMTMVHGAVTMANGCTYTHILVPPGTIIPEDTRSWMKALDPGHELIVDADDETLSALVGAFHDSDDCFSVISSDVPIAMRRRTAESGEVICFLLNESLRPQTLHIKLGVEAAVHEIDRLSCQLNFIEKCTAGSSLAIGLQPVQSRLLMIAPFDHRGGGPEKRRQCGTSLQLDDWTLTLPDGSNHSIASDFPDWADLGFGGYTGFMSYASTFEIEACYACSLSLGKVCYAATILIDGGKVADAVFAPFTVDLGTLDSGQHTLEVRVLNTLANTVFGDPVRLEQAESRGAFKGTYAPVYEPLDRLKLPSGLFGPVTLRIMS